MVKKTQTPEVSIVVPRGLYRRVISLPNFINRAALMRLISGKKNIDRVKLIRRNKWPRENTMSHEFCVKLEKRLDHIEPLVKRINKLAKGQ